MTDPVVPAPPQPTLQELYSKKERQSFIVELLVFDRAVRKALTAINLESMAQMASIFVATNWPNVNGYNIYNADGTELLLMVHGMPFMNQFLKPIQEIAGLQAIRSVIPVTVAGSQGVDLVKLMEEARKAGRLVSTESQDMSAKPAEKAPEKPAAKPAEKSA
jgi:hypothetical protein